MPGEKVGRRSEAHVSRPSLDRREKRFVGQVAVPHRALVIGVAQHLADGVQIDARVDHKAVSYTHLTLPTKRIV